MKMLGRSSDPDDFYRKVILPHNLALNLEYIDQLSLALDLRLMAETWRSIF